MVRLDAQGRTGYGRILIAQRPFLFVEFYRVGHVDVDVPRLETCPVVVTMWCSHQGIASGEWPIVGHVPVGSVTMPDFVISNAEGVWIVRSAQPVLFPPDAVRIPATEDLLRNAQPYGLFGDRAALEKYRQSLDG